jgi:NAD(P)-dependent dehydrogenase (short-subunit alcohol dehydrogenase family)
LKEKIAVNTGAISGIGLATAKRFVAEGEYVFITIGASKGAEELSVYHATKAAIRLFARSWTLDLRHRKIRVNAISLDLLTLHS